MAAPNNFNRAALPPGIAWPFGPGVLDGPDALICTLLCKVAPIQSNPWEPYILLKNVNVLHNYVTTNVSFKDFVKSQEYKDLCRKYPARFPADFNML
jgi:hypothetical protein